MMPEATTEIDQLIEQGLSCYGEGDLDGALSLWERVLVMDPGNAQANSYVDYVRMNYELLTSSEGNTEHSGPFGIGEDEPEYQIEILPGEEVDSSSSAPMFMDTHDEGWMIGDEAAGGEPRTLDVPMFELEADEPLAGGDPGTFESPETGETVSFEDATREYRGGAGRPTMSFEDTTREFPGGGAGSSATAPPGESPIPVASAEFMSEGTPAFGSPEDRQTPQGFSSETTDIRRRDLGFVQPAAAEPRPASAPPELKMTLRTPGSQAPEPPAEADRHHTPISDGDPEDEDDDDDDDLPFDLETPTPGFETEAGYASLDLDLATDLPTDFPTDLPMMSDARSTLDMVGRADTRPAVSGTSDAASLIASLPAPRAPGAPTAPAPATPRSPTADVRPASESPVRELPLPANVPELGAAMAPTKELSYAIQRELLAGRPEPPPPEPARDFADKPTSRYMGRTRSAPEGIDAGPLRGKEPATSEPIDAGASRGKEQAASEPIDAGASRGKERLPSGSSGLIDAGPALGKDWSRPLPGGTGARPPAAAPAAGSQPGKKEPPSGPVPSPNLLITAPTRDLGLRMERRASTDDETTGPFDPPHQQRAMVRGGARHDVPGMDPIDARSAEILEDIDRDAPANELREDRTRRRITVLLERATEWARAADFERSVIAVDLALSEDPNSALAQKLIARNRDTIMNVFQGYLGDLQRTPSLARPLHELGSAPISPRAAFLLSRVDGTLSIDEVLDVSGMPRLEAYRYLCQLFMRGILR